MRHRPAPLTAALLLAAVACSDAPSPTAAPTEVIAPDARVAGQPACSAPPVTLAINALYPPAERGLAQRTFLRARALGIIGRPETAVSGFVALAADALAREGAGTLLDPAGPATTQQKVVELVDRLYVCGGREPVGDVLLDILTDPNRGLRDYAAGPALPGVPFQLTSPSRNFAVADPDGDFFDEPALVIVERLPDAPLQDAYTEFPPRYHVTVLPYAAQANFDDADGTPGPEDVVSGPATAIVGVCPSDRHPPFSELSVLRIPETFLESDPELLAGEELHGEYGLDCSALPPYVAGAEPFSARRFLASLRRAGSIAAGWIAPAPLHAAVVDGGIGGRPRLYSSFVAVHTPKAPTVR